jgi:hypothetical protein
MTYSFSLFTVGLITGLVLALGHLPAVLLPKVTSRLLGQFPRSDFWGYTLLALASLWAFFLIRTIDLGEFDGLRNLMSVGVIVAAVLTGVFVREFLSIRALSILFLLAAEVLLCAAFLQPPLARLWLVFLAYGWIFIGLFCIGLPWLARDLIAWVTRVTWRVQFAGFLGLAYGVILIFLSFAAYR